MVAATVTIVAVGLIMVLVGVVLVVVVGGCGSCGWLW